KWELSGIPCTHAVASIWDQTNNGIDTGIPESYCWVNNSKGCKSKKGGGSQQAGVAGHGDAVHGSQQADVHGSQTT
ncbi:hypothetical protein Tco_1379552, partial [Tanacetum coccineum]